MKTNMVCYVLLTRASAFENVYKKCVEAGLVGRHNTQRLWEFRRIMYGLQNIKSDYYKLK